MSATLHREAIAGRKEIVVSKIEIKLQQMGIDLRESNPPAGNYVRLAVGMAVLPRGNSVEIEMIIEVK